MIIKETKVYLVEEQPGDGTRYQHVIMIVGDCAYVSNNIAMTGGAGVKKQLCLAVGTIKRFVLDMEDQHKTDPNKQIVAVSDLARWMGENPYTLASAIRCANGVLKEITK